MKSFTARIPASLTKQQITPRSSGNLSEVVRRDLERYYATLAREREMLRALLRPHELVIIADVCAGVLFDETTAPLLWANVEDALRNGDAAAGPLVNKLRDLSYPATLALVDAVERCAVGGGAPEEMLAG